uniref:Putative secreted protein n=1 Tax=Anopheles darlingi TaxID=43151 RepID=A0A2M4DFJ4_ANODA
MATSLAMARTIAPMVAMSLTVVAMVMAKNVIQRRSLTAAVVCAYRWRKCATRSPIAPCSKTNRLTSVVRTSVLRIMADAVRIASIHPLATTVTASQATS